MSEARQRLAEPLQGEVEQAQVEYGDAPETGTLAVLNRSEINQQIATAHQFPRSVQRFRKEALGLATMTETIARECVYAIPRDGKVIEGPSIRFAEILVSCWGNCRSAARVVDEGTEFVTSQGLFHDLQSNSAITFEVRRRITDKRGRRYGADMIGVTSNAASSIALRNAILRGVPKALWADIYEAARKTIMGDFKTLQNRRTDAVAAFQAYGVSAEAIFRKLELRGIDDVGMEHLVVLGGMMTAIKDGEVTPEEMFADEGGAVAVAPGAKVGNGSAAPAATKSDKTAETSTKGPEALAAATQAAGAPTVAGDAATSAASSPAKPAATNGAASPPLAPPAAEEVRATLPPQVASTASSAPIPPKPNGTALPDLFGGEE